MRQRPLVQIAIPIEDPDSDLLKILEAWNCQTSTSSEDEDYIRKSISTPDRVPFLHEVKKSAYRDLPEDRVRVEFTRNLVTRLYNHLIEHSNANLPLPEEILGRASDSDSDRLIDSGPPKTVT